MAKRLTTDEGSERANAIRTETSREEIWLEIRDALAGLRFGSISIIVQDGIVVQIDRTEKRRTQPVAQRCS